MPIDTQQMLLDRLERIDRKLDEAIERITRVEERQRNYEELQDAVSELQSKQAKQSGAGLVVLKLAAFAGWGISLYFGLR
jgi:predicted nuclease with TOPRIM domain